MQYDPYDDPERQFGGGGQSPAPSQGEAPAGYRWENGRLVPTAENLATKPLSPSDPNFNPNVNTQTTWDPATGQPTDIFPGWHWDSKMARYMPGDAPPGGGGNGGGGGGGGGPTPTGSMVGDISQFPTYTPPAAPSLNNLQAPSPYTFTPFVNGTFTAPTLEEARNQPGYQFGLQQGQQALENSAAARGTLRGGGTLKDLFGYTNAAAEQNYGNVFNQDLTTFNTNEGNRFGAWAANTGQGKIAYDTNWGVNKDVNTSENRNAQDTYSNLRQNAADVFNPQFDASKLTFADSYNRWLAKLNSLTNIATAGAS